MYLVLPDQKKYKMKKVLHIISSPRGKASYSIQLGNAVVEKLRQAHPDSVVEELNLADAPFPHLEEAHLTSFFTPPESRTEQDKAAVKHSDDAIKQLTDADVIVIGAPMYNFSIPSTLKTWLDHIVRAGITFSYDESGIHGLVTGKKVYIAETTGGIYSEGPMQPYNFTTPYLKAVLGHIGMKDITVFRVEGTNIPGIQEQALQKGLDSIVVN